MIDDPSLYQSRMHVTKFAITNRRPAIFDERSYAEGGGLIGYGANFSAMFRRAAAFVNKILKGANPADLPVEQPMRFDLVVNGRTAKILSLPIPESIRIRAELLH